ncbi:MAG: DJ-1/PfpI family protein [Ruminococcaceae bacterium]|nr:DJ-1/PfpI family protein [Oscillospiraceae bacterium]
MVLVFLADGFEEAEALVPVDVLKRCGLDVRTVSIMETNVVTGTHGIKVIADEVYKDLSPSSPDAVILPGGLPGADHLQSSPYVKEHIVAANKEGRLIGAICAAPKVLGAYGLLEGKKAVCYPGFEDKLKGAHVSDHGVMVCDNIITSRAAGKCFDFAFEIAKALGKEKEAESVKESILYLNL